MIRTATISPDGLYRYDLTRSWGGLGGRVLWIMLNPSTADADVDDPTIRRCIGFSKAWGYAGLVVVNLFALRSPNPKTLRQHPDPVGPENADYLNRWSQQCGLIVAAWGAFDIGRASDALPVPLYCLGTTKAGAPRHPLYVRGDQPLVPWRVS